MSVEQLVLSLPRAEKLQLMETLWNDLSQQPELLESPEWHLAELRETESRLEAGTEAVLDWTEAKRLLVARR